ncbi:MAG TPA: HlyD family efflux transporter periplasmic adaptor subunit [Xanthomonadaceae bacterium]|nr:HlyD family efflux transporter periplasmic adaptor subunit [Xanthomonadaceae bacterium]
MDRTLHQAARAPVALIALVTVALAACNGEDAQVALGTIEFDRIELTATQPEPLREIVHDEGAQVSAGAIILRQDDARLAAQRARLEAERAQASAALDEVLRGPRKELLAVERARLSGALAELENASADLARARELRARGLAPQADLDRAQARHGRARAGRDEAARLLEASVTGATREQIAQARHRLAAAEAAVHVQQVELDRLTLTAPVAGLVETLPFQLGERPPAGATLAVLLDTARPYARIYVPEPWRARVAPGTELTVRIDGREVTGVVRRIAAEPAFTPFFALTQKDRSRLAYLAEVDLPAAVASGRAGVPVEVLLPEPP